MLAAKVNIAAIVVASMTWPAAAAPNLCGSWRRQLLV